MHTTLLLETMAQEMEQGEKIVEVDTINDAILKIVTNYMVKSPETGMDTEVIPTPPLVTERIYVSAYVMCRTRWREWRKKPWQQLRRETLKG